MLEPLNKLAARIFADWGPPKDGRPVWQIYAKPYAEAMLHLEKISDQYGLDDAEDIVLRFLVNAANWRGEVARDVKSQLNQHLKAKSIL